MLFNAISEKEAKELSDWLRHKYNTGLVVYSNQPDSHRYFVLKFNRTITRITPESINIWSLYKVEGGNWDQKRVATAPYNLHTTRDVREAKAVIVHWHHPIMALTPSDLMDVSDVALPF